MAVSGNTEGKEVANLFASDLVVIREREYFLAVSNKIFHKVVPGVLRCKWRGVFTGVCSKLLSGLMSCRKVGLREFSSSWRNRSNGRHVCMFRNASPHVLLCVSVLPNPACVFCKFCCRQSLKS